MPTNLASSAPHMQSPATYDEDIRDWGDQANPIAGNSNSHGRLLHKGENGHPETGLWQCTPGTWPLEISHHELHYFIMGNATYTHEGGETIEVRTGSFALFPAGWKGICTVHTTMRSTYILS
jgi:uncharacterized protein